MRTNKQTFRIYDFEVQLDREKEYSEIQEYPFEIKIPADADGLAPKFPEVGGMVGKGMKIAQAAAGFTVKIPISQAKWYLSDKLDISGGLDVKKKADITIG